MDSLTVLFNYFLVFLLVYSIATVRRESATIRLHLTHAKFWQKHYRHLTLCITNEIVRSFHEYREKNGVPFDNYIITLDDEKMVVRLFLNDEQVDVDTDVEKDFWLALTEAADQLSAS